MNRIHDSLRKVLARHRIVFWYDEAGEWSDDFDSFDSDGVECLRVSGNEFATKVRIAREPDADRRFLVYVPQARPHDSENWLLDLLLQGHQFRADRASLALEDVGLPQDYLDVVRDHAAFFRSNKRVESLKRLVDKDDTIRDVRLKMMAVLAGTEAEIDALLLEFLHAGPHAKEDPADDALETSALTEAFWREVGRTFGYASETPSVRDFAFTLFRGANPLDEQVPLHPHAKVFLRRWQDSQKYASSFREWSKYLERELHVAPKLGEQPTGFSIGEWDTFEVFERFTLHRLCSGFSDGVAAADLRATILERRDSFWYTEHEHGYLALGHAIDLRELLAAAELSMSSVADGVRRYRSTWWQIDRAYRRFTYHLRQYGQVQVMKDVAQWVEKSYVNNFLLVLSDRWSDKVAALDAWACDGVAPQRRFFDTYVEPFRKKGQKVFVIVSDALRYEAAVEFAERLASENRWQADVDAMLASLPTYTQLGMASLLPNKELAVDPTTASVTVDGKSATGTQNRHNILQAACGTSAVAIQAQDFLALNTKTEGRALMRDHEAIYIFHNQIDAIGDDLKSEGKTFDAVEQAFDELDQIMRKVANINGTNMLLTADHGFLFQQEDVVTDDMTALPASDAIANTNRRFALGDGLPEGPKVKVFSAKQLGLSGDWSAAFPRSLGRFPVKGSGKRYVHGGFSLQEAIVPVVRIRKARSDDTKRVGVDMLRVPTKITTGQTSVVLFQEEPVGDKVLPRTLRVGVYSRDGEELSEVKTQQCDLTVEEARHREITVLLTLSHEADAFNNQEVEIRLEETIPGTSQTVTYKSHPVRLQKPFTSDFDDF